MLVGYENDEPSCSLAEALTHQELFVNRALTSFALHLVWTMFRRGEIRVAGCFLNLQEMTTVPIPVNGLPGTNPRTTCPVPPTSDEGGNALLADSELRQCGIARRNVVLTHGGLRTLG